MKKNKVVIEFDLYLDGYNIYVNDERVYRDNCLDISAVEWVAKALGATVKSTELSIDEGEALSESLGGS